MGGESLVKLSVTEPRPRPSGLTHLQTKWFNFFTLARQWSMWVQRNHNHYCSDHRQQFTFLRWVFIWNNPKWLPASAQPRPGQIPGGEEGISIHWVRRGALPVHIYLGRGLPSAPSVFIDFSNPPMTPQLHLHPSTSTPPISFPTLRLTRLNCPAALNEDPQSQTKATESAKHSCCWHHFYLMWLVNASYFIPFILSKTYKRLVAAFSRY